MNTCKVPKQYASNDKLSDAYKRGWNHGHGFACHNVPKLGQKLWVDSLGKVTVDSENIREVHQSLCYSAEENSRSFSPFEFTAKKFNEAEQEEPEDSDESWVSSEELWEAFEAGTSAAINADLERYTDEDYGIEPETEE